MLNSSPDLSQKYKIYQQFSQDFISRSFLAENGSKKTFVEARILSQNEFNSMHSVQQLESISAIYKEFKHQNIARFIELGTTGSNEIAFFSEYKNGYTLAFLFDHFAGTKTQIPIHLASFIITEICTGLDYIHSRRAAQDEPFMDSVFHGLSAENVLISRAGEIIIRGVELAPLRFDYIKNNRNSDKIKFFPSLAPEYFRDNPVVDFRADLFSLGILFLEFLSGKRLDSTMSVNEQIDYIFRKNQTYFSDRPDEAQERLQTILHSILADIPDNRYSATNQLYMDLLHQLILTASNANFTDELAFFIQNLDIEPASPADIKSFAIQQDAANAEAEPAQEQLAEPEGNEALAYLQSLMQRRDPGSSPADSGKSISLTPQPDAEPEAVGQKTKTPQEEKKFNLVSPIEQNTQSGEAETGAETPDIEENTAEDSEEHVDYVISEDFIDITDLPETEEMEINIDLTQEEIETTERKPDGDSVKNFVEFIDEEISEPIEQSEDTPPDKPAAKPGFSVEIKDDFTETEDIDQLEICLDKTENEGRNDVEPAPDEKYGAENSASAEPESAMFDEDDTAIFKRNPEPGTEDDNPPDKGVFPSIDQVKPIEEVERSSDASTGEIARNTDDLAAETGRHSAMEKPGNEAENIDAGETSAATTAPEENIALFQGDDSQATPENSKSENIALEYEAIFGIDNSNKNDTPAKETNNASALPENGENHEGSAPAGFEKSAEKNDEIFFHPGEAKNKKTEQASPKQSNTRRTVKTVFEPKKSTFTSTKPQQGSKKRSIFSGKNPFGKKEKDEPLFKIIDNSSNSKSASRFYSIIDESSAHSSHTDGEEIKTIIDVVRLSARSNPKVYILGAAMIPVMFILFTLVDTFSQFTSYGTGIYDYFFPPAIRIETIPSGAQVYLDDKPLAAKTALQLDEIEPGVHKLKLTLPKFDPIIKSFNVLSKGQLYVAGEEERHGSVPYIFRFKVQLELSSQPPGATIFINDTKIADKTPATVFWEIGEKPISIRMEKGNYPQIAGLTFDAQKDRESISDRRFWRFQRLNKMKHHIAIEGVFRKEIKVESVPSRAEIFVDENTKASGITGINGKLLFTEGEHIITLRKPGYIDRRFSLRVDDKSPIFLKETLSRYITISARDIESTDGMDINATVVQIAGRGKTIELNQKTPARVRLLPYTYTAVIRKANFEEQTVRIKPQDKQVVARMVPIPTDVSITVNDATTKDPLSNVTILYNTKRSLNNAIILGATNTEGKLVARVPDGYFAIFARKEGYRLTLKSMRFKQGRRNRAVLWMRRQY